MKDDHLFLVSFQSLGKSNHVLWCSWDLICSVCYSVSSYTVVDSLHSFLRKNYSTVVFQFLINFCNVQFCSMIWWFFPHSLKFQYQPVYFQNHIYKKRENVYTTRASILFLSPDFHISGDGSRFLPVVALFLPY